MSTSSSVRWASMLAATLGFCRCLGIIPGVIPHQPDAAPERGFIVAVLAQGVDPASELAELRELARTALVEPIGELVQHRAGPANRTYVGKGKLEELKRAYNDGGAEVLLVDDELAPAQQRILENDRRLARRRITLLRRRLLELRKQRDVRRKARQRAETPTVALAGYTNVGKSTLLNALTDAEVSVDNRLFETLDPTTRGFDHDGRRYLVTDTVGFIRRLPTQLVEGFAATLEETLVADLVLHVLDGSASDERLDEQIDAVDAVLREIGADELPNELVINKIDAVHGLRRRRLANQFPEALQVSALTGAGLVELRARIAERFADMFEAVRLLLPYDEGGKLAELYALGAPIEERTDTPEGVLVRARLPRRELRRFARYLVAEARSEPATGAR